MRPWISVPGSINIMKQASLVLVHNEEFRDFLEPKYQGVNFYTLPDNLPDFNNSLTFEFDDNREKYFLVILSFAYDDPLWEMFEAFKMYLNNSDLQINFYITGNYKKNIHIYNTYSKISGINFLGYIEDTKYVELLKNAYGVISLSIREMVQQCAVVEAISANIPLICSNNSTNRRIFNQGAVLTENNSEDIYSAIIKFVYTGGLLKQGVHKVRKEWEIDWIKRFVEFKKMIDF
jgi:glycosyltransferase involved in cell wall biosynthesis